MECNTHVTKFKIGHTHTPPTFATKALVKVMERVKSSLFSTYSNKKNNALRTNNLTEPKTF